VRLTLREVLADSHIAAVAIMLLLIRSLDSGFRAIGRPIFSLFDFLITLVAIRDIPYAFGPHSLGYWLSQAPTFTHFLNAVVSLSAAWALSLWVYRVGPCRSLIECRAKLARRIHG